MTATSYQPNNINKIQANDITSPIIKIMNQMKVTSTTKIIWGSCLVTKIAASWFLSSCFKLLSQI